MADASTSIALGSAATAIAALAWGACAEWRAFKLSREVSDRVADILRLSAKLSAGGRARGERARALRAAKTAELRAETGLQ